MSSVLSQHTRFSLLPQETLLEGLERTGHMVEYQCRRGYCGACRIRMLDGEVVYLEQPLAFIAADEILPCCCVPNSDIRLDCELSLALRMQQTQAEMFPAQLSLFDDLSPTLERNAVKKMRRQRSSKVKPKVNSLSLF